MRSAPWTAVLTVALLAAACGTASSPRPSSGAHLFASSCGGCHTLTGVDSPRHQGGDLLHFHLTRSQLLQFAREMPVRHPLTAAQLDAVTAYVLAAERRGKAVFGFAGAIGPARSNTQVTTRRRAPARRRS